MSAKRGLVLLVKNWVHSLIYYETQLKSHKFIYEDGWLMMISAFAGGRDGIPEQHH
jgi:hypothetical protein